MDIPDHVTLIAVSKNQPPEKIQAALDDGLRHFGENRLQEAQTHWRERRARYPDLQLHLIGPLQSNKAADAVALFDYIHTIDREKIAKALAEEMQKQNRFLPCFIQVNTGNEPQKSGVSLDEFPALFRYCREVAKIKIIGLMCIPPVDESPEKHFTLLKHLAEEHSLKELSMGMSADYQTAIDCGATFIRLGTALFGARD